MARGKRTAKKGNRKSKSRGRRHDGAGADRLVGYFACRGVDAICEHDACIITGAKQAMRKLLDRLGPEAGGYVIRATTAAEVLAGICQGAAYALDELAYGRLRPPARKIGLPLPPEDFSDPGPIGLHFVRIQIPAAHASI